MKLYGIAFLGTSCIFLIATLLAWLKKRRFYKYGAVCSGSVREVRCGYVKGADSMRVYEFIVTYDVDGVVYTAHLPAAAGEVDDAAGRQLELRYNMRRPEKVMRNSSEKSNEKLLFLTSLVLITIGALFFAAI